jgi:hypothetical protein
LILCASSADKFSVGSWRRFGKSCLWNIPVVFFCTSEAITERLLRITGNVLQLQEVGDIEALNCLSPQNLIRSTKLHLTTEPPIFVGAVVCSFFFSTETMSSNIS